MYAGEIVEPRRRTRSSGAAASVHGGLLAAMPRLDLRAERLATIDGVLPDMTAAAAAASRTAARSPLEQCRAEPPPLVDLGGALVALPARAAGAARA